jgi:polyhydroxyalkanoate synthesis repressor PhaR
MVGADAHGFLWRWQVEASGNRPTLSIKKYPNRRYYDATRSRHVTLQQVHELVREGHDVTIMDSRSGTDITNAVLAQLILDKESGRVLLFPTDLLHAVIRANDAAVASAGAQYAGPVIAALQNGKAAADPALDGTVSQFPGTEAGQTATETQRAAYAAGDHGAGRGDFVTSFPPQAASPDSLGPNPDSAYGGAGGGSS